MDPALQETHGLRIAVEGCVSLDPLAGRIVTEL